MSARRAAIVTGGSAGIGAAICHALAQQEWEVLNLDVCAPARDGAGQWLQVDMGDTHALADALRTAVSRHCVLGLVNNVAAIRPASLQDTRLADFDLEVAVGARAALQCAQAVLPAMRQAAFGRIVNITSRAALGKELRTGYSAAKGALNAMTRTWALELAREGITVNAVAPGPIATEAFESANPAASEHTRRILAGVPVGRLGRAEDVARAAAFMMDPRNGFVTGQVLYVCGGITVGLSS